MYYTTIIIVLGVAYRTDAVTRISDIIIKLNGGEKVTCTPNCLSGKKSHLNDRKHPIGQRDNSVSTYKYVLPSHSSLTVLLFPHPPRPPGGKDIETSEG